MGELRKVEHLRTELCVMYKLSNKLVIYNGRGEVDIITFAGGDVCSFNVTEEAVDTIVDIFH